MLYRRIVRGKSIAGTIKAKMRRGDCRQRYATLKPFIIISSSYLLFTTTDGAIRMIVLLNAYKLGFTAMEVAIMFTLYEIAGVFTNLLAGLMGARWGIKSTLLAGLVLQLGGIGMLFGWSNGWSKLEGIIYVTIAQMLCGIAKDLTKLGGKTVTKLVTPDEKQSSLFKLVSFITGFKNSLKGAGYFIGAATVAASYYGALALLIGMILLALPWACVGLSNKLGRTRKENVTLRSVFKTNYNISVLSAARMFLFGSRDAWFEVPLPFFLRDSTVGLGWSRSLTGLFLGLFIIVYGQMQSWTPQLVLKPLGQSPANKYVEVLWVSLLTLSPATMAAVVLGSSAFQDHHVNQMTVIMTVGLAVFCILFAINSSVHSYLILRYSEGDKVAMNVGFYYMSNAAGRLVGTVLSGALYSYVGASRVDGFGACFILAAAFCVVCTALTTFIKDDVAGLRCGRFSCVAAQPVKATKVQESAGKVVGALPLPLQDCPQEPAGSLPSAASDGTWKDTEDPRFCTHCTGAVNAASEGQDRVTSDAAEPGVLTAPALQAMDSFSLQLPIPPGEHVTLTDAGK